MSEGQVRETEAKKFQFVDPFCGKKTVAPVIEKDLKRDPNKMEEIALELDKETGNTNVVITGTRDLDKEIQEFKDQTGFEGMRKLIAQGKATPRDFFDDGKHGQDVSGLPDNVHDAYRAAQANNAESANLFKKLGISPIYSADGSIDMAATENAISNAIKSVFDAAQNKEVKEDETK